MNPYRIPPPPPPDPWRSAIPRPVYEVAVVVGAVGLILVAEGLWRFYYRRGTRHMEIA